MQERNYFASGKFLLKRKIPYRFKWIQLNENAKIGYCILKKLVIFTSSNCKRNGRVQFSSKFLQFFMFYA